MATNDSKPMPSEKQDSNFKSSKREQLQITPNASRDSGLNLAAFKVDDSQFQEGGKHVVVDIPVSKPNPKLFVRVKDDLDYTLVASLYEEPESRDLYLVTQEVSHEMGPDAKRVTLHLCTTREGSNFIWPVPHPSTESRENAWNTTHREAAELAKTMWVRMRREHASDQFYSAMQGTAINVEPVWIDKSWGEILEIAFRGRIIDDRNHSALRQLRGEM